MNLIQITEKDFDVILDLRYASDNNVTGRPVYKKPLCYLHKEAIEPFKKAIVIAKKLGYKFKIWDFFRPFEAQVEFFKWNQEESPDMIIFSDPNFAFNPDPKNPRSGLVAHCRGVALDLTLVDFEGKEIDMGTDFDDITEKAFTLSELVSQNARNNRNIFKTIMMEAGFVAIPNEWWHFELPNPRKYDILYDKDLNEKMM